MKGLILSLIMLLSTATQASAEWRKAESPHFVVYSTNSEGALRAYAEKLERYDFFLRNYFNLTGDRPVRKLPVYLVSNIQELRQIRPDMGSHIAGVYVPAAEDIFAVAIRGQNDDFLLHEYFHHFSFQSGAAAGYPGWLIEGLAEYFATAEIDDDKITVGTFNDNRVLWLVNEPWLPLEELLSKGPSAVRTGSYRATYYPVAGLLTHYFMSDRSRTSQLDAYVAKVGAGEPPVEAMVSATGMSLNQLRNAMRDHMYRARAGVFDSEAPASDIVVTTLPRSANDLLLIAQRLKAGTQTKDRAETAALVRRLAASHPDDPFAQLQLGHAELHFGDPDAGEVVLTRLLEREPENVEALQLMSTRFARLATETPEEAAALLGRARGYLARAYRADPDNYYTLNLIARSRETAEGYPNANDLDAWQQAFILAPQLPGIRLGLAAALMKTEQFDTAARLLQPLANASHGGSAIQAAQTMLEAARAGQAPPSADAIDAATERDPTQEPTPEPDAPAT